MWATGSPAPQCGLPAPAGAIWRPALRTTSAPSQAAHSPAHAACSVVDVAFTDIGDVLPLLRHNVEQNVSPAALKRELPHRPCALVAATGAHGGGEW